MVFHITMTVMAFALPFAQDPLPRVTILTTGGTIASRVGAATLEGPVLVQAVPELLTHASITVEEIARTGSSRMTPEIWLSMARRITELYAQDSGLAGIVVTHGLKTFHIIFTMRTLNSQ